MRLKVLIMILAVVVLAPLPVAAEEVISYTFFETTYIDNGMDDNLALINGRERIDLNIDEDNGFGLRGSLALTPNIHIFGGYSGSDMDVSATATADWPSLDEMRAAFFTRPGEDNWDAMCDLNDDGMINVVDLGLMRAAGDGRRVLDSAAVDGDVTDWRIGIGVNRMLTERISGYAQLHWNDRDLDFDSAQFLGEVANASADDSGIGATLGARGLVTDRLELRGHVTYTPVGDIDLLADNDDDRVNNDVLGGLAAEYRVTDTLRINAGIEGDSDAHAWMLGARFDIGARD